MPGSILNILRAVVYLFSHNTNFNRHIPLLPPFYRGKFGIESVLGFCREMEYICVYICTERGREDPQSVLGKLGAQKSQCCDSV